MKKIFNKRTLIILGTIIVLIGIPLTTFVLKNQTIIKSRASNSEEPKDIRITNVSDKSFTITYQTDTPITGSISYGRDKRLGQSELEDVDMEKGSFSPKKIHSMSLRKLTPATKYYLTITSGSKTFLHNNAPFEVATGTDISSSSAMQTIIKGKIILPDGNAPSEALVYLNAENSQTLSSTTAKNGQFSFSLKELRTNNLSSYFNVNENTVFKIVATNGSLKSTVSTSLNQTDSIPTITLSNDYNFTQETSSPIASKSAKSAGFPSIPDFENKSKPEIINPKENQSFTDQKPQFRGTSLPNEKVEIIIHSDEQITTQVTADSNGNWTYKPSANLSPGKHTITIKTRDSSGILTTIMQSFTVYAAESPTSIPATPSATPISTTTPASTPIIMPLNPIIAPIQTLIPSPTPIFIQTTTKGGLPPTGTSPILLIVGGIAAAVTGLALFLLTHAIL